MAVQIAKPRCLQGHSEAQGRHCTASAVAPNFECVSVTKSNESAGVEVFSSVNGASPTRAKAPPSREALLEAYRAQHRELKETRKKREKLVIIENVRKRPPHLMLKQTTSHHAGAGDNSNGRHHLTVSERELHDEKKKGLKQPDRMRFPRFSRFIPQQFKRPQADERPPSSRTASSCCGVLALILQLRQTKSLVSESNSELRDVISQIGVPFGHFSDALDKLHDSEVTLEDLLVICGHPLVLCKDSQGNTPLHYAAEGGYLNLCQLLIERGGNINDSVDNPCDV